MFSRLHDEMETACRGSERRSLILLCLYGMLSIQSCAILLLFLLRSDICPDNSIVTLVIASCVIQLHVAVSGMVNVARNWHGPEYLRAIVEIYRELDES